MVAAVLGEGVTDWFVFLCFRSVNISWDNWEFVDNQGAQLSFVDRLAMLGTDSTTGFLVVTVFILVGTVL